MQKDIPSEEIKTGEEDDDDNGDNLLKDSNDSKSEWSLIQHDVSCLGLYPPCSSASTYFPFTFMFLKQKYI